MYQPSASGRASSRSVSAVGAQSTTITSHRPDRRLQPQLEQRQHLLGARDDGELLGGDRVHAGHVEHREQVALDLRPGLLEAQLRVDLLDEEVRRDLGRLRADRGAPKASASECAGSVESTSVRRPAAAASAAVPAATVDLPTPPLPVNRRMRTMPRRARPAAQPSDSTRFFRPLSAVSMRIFSPLRLSMPISGMETSSASR